MTQPPSWTWKKKAVVLAAWVLLMALLGAYHGWRIRSLWVWHEPPPLVALWLLAVYLGVIIAGLVLACTRWLPGGTPMRRYWASLCVGVICMVAMGLVLFCVWTHLYMRLFIMWCVSAS